MRRLDYRSEGAQIAPDDLLRREALLGRPSALGRVAPVGFRDRGRELVVTLDDEAGAAVLEDLGTDPDESRRQGVP